MDPRKRFQIGERVLVKTRGRHGLPAKVVGFNGARVRILLQISGCEIELAADELDPVERPSA